MSPSFERAMLLFAQSRFDLAEEELRKGLLADPNDPNSHALLGLCLVERQEMRAATREAEQAIALGPDEPFAHYALARILHERQRFEEAEQAAREALRLDPWNPDYHGLRAAIHYDQRRWPAALAAAEEGLVLDPEHVVCTNLRAMALIQLGRREEAGSTIGAALARDPENAFTHSNQGWALLHQGQPAKALEHFREALRLDPMLEMARAGIVEALKARNIVYRVFLAYFLWMSRLSHTMQWVVILGGYFGYRLLRALAEQNPALAPWLWPILIVYLLFVVLTWIADPVFNLLLRIDRFGRLALSREQIVASNWIGACLGSAALCALAAVLLASPGLFIAAFALLLLTLPVSATFHCQAGWPRNVMATFSIVLALLALAGLSSLVVSGAARAPGEGFIGSLGSVFLGLFLLGAVLSSWVANALVMVRPRR